MMSKFGKQKQSKTNKQQQETNPGIRIPTFALVITNYFQGYKGMKYILSFNDSHAGAQYPWLRISALKVKRAFTSLSNFEKL